VSRGCWLTPSAPPENKFFSRRITIPADPNWLALVNGAIDELTKPWNYEQYGDLTPDQTAQAFADIYDSYRENENEPPFAEDADELDGEPKQEWYVDLEDWIIEGFLAVTFSPAAAIVYRTIVPKMRLALRSGSIGAAFRVLLNGVEILTGDSYGAIPEILEYVLDLAQAAIDNDLGDPPWDLSIVHDGEPGEKLEVVRSAQPAACSPGDGLMIGEILWGAWGAVPDHCLACDGTQYLKSAYPDLWDVLDAAYGDDSTHFHVPDLRGRAALGNGQGSGLTDRVVGASGGEENHQLTEAELATHNHTLVRAGGVGPYFNTDNGAPHDATYVAGNTPSTGYAGSGTAHNTMAPFAVLRAVIVYELAG
jgi:microcystin-dependent protein